MVAMSLSAAGMPCSQARPCWRARRRRARLSTSQSGPAPPPPCRCAWQGTSPAARQAISRRATRVTPALLLSPIPRVQPSAHSQPAASARRALLGQPALHHIVFSTLCILPVQVQTRWLLVQVALDTGINRTGDTWHVCLEGLKDLDTLAYGWRADAADISQFYPGVPHEHFPWSPWSFG